MTKESPQYHLLPKDNADLIVDILRKAAGLPPLTTPTDTTEKPAT